jgi:hypothetical protein
VAACAAPLAVTLHLLLSRRAQWRCKKGLFWTNSFAEGLFLNFVLSLNYFCPNCL